MRDPIRRRMPTQSLGYEWPFLYSVVPGRGLVQNVPKPRKTIETKPRHRIITKKGK